MHNILIVDSNLSFAISLKRALEEGRQYSVRTVSRLSSVQDALATKAYQVVVLDTDMEFHTPAQIVAAAREIQKDFVLIITSQKPTDQALQATLGAQAFLMKPYFARLLLDLLPKLLKGETAGSANLDLHLENQERQLLLDPLLQVGVQAATQAPVVTEPPPSAEDSKLSEIIDFALDPEVSQKIYTVIEEEAKQATQPSSPAPSAPPLTDPEAETPAKLALQVVQTVAELDNLLAEIRTYAVSSPLPSPPISVANPLSPLLATVDPPPPSSASQWVELPIAEQDTQYDFSAPPPLLPDQDWLNRLGLPPAPATLPDLQPSSVGEITQQLLAVEEAAVEQALHKEVEAERLPSSVVAHYALHLTQFALESSALGVLLSRGGQRLAHAGTLDATMLDYILALSAQNEALQGANRTRVMYRKVEEVGEILVYTIATLDDLLLTLIFSAETPLKVIRRQAARLSESLQGLPSISSAELEQAPPPEPESAPPPPLLTDDFTAYACVWLVEHERDSINSAAAKLIESWVREICGAAGWVLQAAQIEREWLCFVVAAPPSILPSVLAQTLMEGTAQRALRLDPIGTRTSPWGAGYLVRTPPQALKTADIERFVRFYRAGQGVA